MLKTSNRTEVIGFVEFPWDIYHTLVFLDNICEFTLKFEPRTPMAYVQYILEIKITLYYPTQIWFTSVSKLFYIGLV